MVSVYLLFFVNFDFKRDTGFCFYCSKKELGGGTVLDLGVYVIQFCQWIFKQAPKSITASGSLNQEGVDMEMNAIINYGNNKVATVQTSASKTLDNAAIIKGTKGKITVSIYYFKLRAS